MRTDKKKPKPNYRAKLSKTKFVVPTIWHVIENRRRLQIALNKSRSKEICYWCSFYLGYPEEGPPWSSALISTRCKEHQYLLRIFRKHKVIHHQVLGLTYWSLDDIVAKLYDLPKKKIPKKDRRIRDILI